MYFKISSYGYGHAPPGEGTLTMKVTTYAPPFRPPFLGLWKICIVSAPIVEQKWGKCRISTPIFGQHLTKCIVSTPFLALCSAFRVNGRCWASLFKTQPRPPPPPGMLPQSSVGQMDRAIQTRPPAERQSQLPKYLLLRVSTTINVNSSSHSAAYMRRWIGSALLQIMVCRLFGTKPLSEQTFRYSQELSPGPLVYMNKFQWNFNQKWKLFIHGNASEYIVCKMAAILSRGGGGGG